MGDAARLVIQTYRFSGMHGRARALAEARLEAFTQAGERRGQACMWLSLAETYLDEGKLQTAAESCNIAVEHFQELEDMRFETLTLLTLSTIHLRVGMVSTEEHPPNHFRDAMRTATVALKRSQDLGDEYLEARARRCHACAAFHAEQSSEALKSAQAAWKLVRGLASVTREGDWRATRSLLLVSQLALYVGRFQEGLDAAEESLTLARELHLSSLWKATAIGMVAEAHCALEDHDVAVVLVHEALDEARRETPETQTRQVELLLLDVLACIHMSKNPEAAVAAAEEALVINRETGEREREANTLVTIAKAHFANKQVMQGVHAIDMASRIFQRMDNRAMVAETQHLLAVTYIAEGDFWSANRCANDAWGTFHELGDHCSAGVALMSVAYVKCARGDVRRACATMAEAQCIFQKLGNKLQEANAISFQANFQAECGHLAEAVRMVERSRRLFRAVDDSRREIDALQQLVSLHTEMAKPFETAKVATEGLALCKVAGYRRHEVHLQFYVGQAHLQAAQYETRQAAVRDRLCRALYAATDCTNLARTLDMRGNLASALYLTAQVHNVLDAHREAVCAVEEALLLFREEDMEELQGHALLLMADSMELLGNREDAADAVFKAQYIFEKKGGQGAEEVARMLAQLQANTKLVTVPASVAETGPPVMDADGGMEIVEEWAGPDPDEVKAILIEHARDLVGDDALLDNDSSLMDVGMDSLSSLDFRSQLAKEFQIKMPATVVFEYPSISRLADYVVNRLSIAANSK